MSKSPASLAAALLLAAGCFNPAGNATSAAGTSSTGSTTEATGSSTTAPTTTDSPTSTSPGTTGTTDEVTGTTGPGTTSMMPPPGCGNGVEEPGELCDDGNADNTDACLADCTPAGCGDGFVRDQVEQCDAGANNGNDKPCTLLCQKNVCGDTLICPSCQEECEGGLGCNRECKFSQRYVFVTNTAHPAGSLGGLAGADQLCMAAAQDIDVLAGRTFVAWLSSSTANAIDRVGVSQVPFVLLSGQAIANNSSDLVDAELAAAITVDQYNQSVPDTYPVWTGTEADGMKTADAVLCGDWTENVGMGRFGVVTATDYQWTDGGLTDCGKNGRLYCFQTGL